MTLDLIYILGLFSLVGFIAIVYSIRVMIKGRPQYDRIDKQGGSALLSKRVMEGAYWVMQPMGRALVSMGATPNQLSWASLFLGLLAGVCLAFGHFGFGAGFATFSAILDSMDGMVARLTGLSSDAGEVLDATVDRYAEFFFIAGLIIYYREIPTLVLLALLALVGSFMVSYSSAKAEALQVSPPSGSMRRPERAVYLTVGAALSPITIPWLEVYREFSIPVGHPMVIALGVVAVLANVSAVERMWAIAKAMREREAAQKVKVAAEAVAQTHEYDQHARR